MRVVFVDQVAIPRAQGFEAGVDVSNAAPICDFLVECLVIHPADGHSRAVIKKDVHCEDIIYGLAGHLSVHTARVVAQHATEGAVIMRGGIRTPSQSMGLCGITQCVAHCSWFDACKFLLGIQFHDVVEVLAPVHNYGDIAALTSKARSAATGENGCAKLATHSDRAFNVLL